MQHQNTIRSIKRDVIYVPRKCLQWTTFLLRQIRYQVLCMQLVLIHRILHVAYLYTWLTYTERFTYRVQYKPYSEEMHARV